MRRAYGRVRGKLTGGFEASVRGVWGELTGGFWVCLQVGGFEASVRAGLGGFCGQV